MDLTKGQTFHIVDYIISIFALAASFSIGVYHALVKPNATTGQYLMAGRKLKIIPTSLSLLISYISAISILGNSAEAYYYGVDIFFIAFAYIIGCVVISLTLIPLFYPLRLTSVNEYFYLRYRAKCIVHFACFLQTMTFVIASGITLYATAVMLQSMSVIPVWMAILSLGMLSTIYTTIGGFRAVIWSDVFQCVVLFGGLIAIVVLGTIKVGGLSDVWTIYRDYDRLKPTLSPSPFKRTMWAFSIGFSFSITCMFGIVQVGVQRYCALQNLHDAKRSMICTIPINIIVQSLTCFSGVVAFAYFTKTGCDPFSAAYIKNKNQIIPHFVKEVLNYPAIPGLFVACVLCGCLSNLSSIYSSSAALIWEDTLKQRFAASTEDRKTRVTKVLALMAGVASIVSGFAVATMGGTLMQITATLSSCTITPLMVLTISGATSRRHNYKCVLIAAFAAFGINVWLSMGNAYVGAQEPIRSTITTNCTFAFVGVQEPIRYAVATNCTSAFIGIEEPRRSTIATNCTSAFRFKNPIYNESLHILTTVSTIYHEATKSLKKDASLIYQISYMWFAPIGLSIGLTITFLLSLLPAFQERRQSDVKPELLFPFVRRLLKLQAAPHAYCPTVEETSGIYVPDVKSSKDLYAMTQVKTIREDGDNNDNINELQQLYNK